ncbi:MAG: VF530 family DNA-binding protein [Fibrobacterota bacterium]
MNSGPDKHKNDSLHGVTLEALLKELVEHLGWEQMADAVRIRCFYSDPSIQSSLKFLRKTPWARKKVESLYLDYQWRCELLSRDAAEEENR